MIKFHLICEHEHEFEGWFASNGEFQEQKKRDLLSCPICESGKVTKALMAPSVRPSRKGNVPAPSTNVAMSGGAGIAAETLSKLRALRKEIESVAENVGEKFPEEARKIHYGEAEARGIYGKASLEDAASLHEEGVNVFPLPELPEDKN